MVARGFRMISGKGNEQIAQLLSKVWNSNNSYYLLCRAALFGGVTGDAFFYVTVRNRNNKGDLLPKEQWTPKIAVLNPAYCFPFWSEVEADEISTMLIQFPILNAEKNYSLLSVVIRPHEFQTFVNEELKDTQPNPFGRINVIHVPNELRANSRWGYSDLRDVKDVNEEYNLVSASIRRIIKYHAEPTTIIFGARFSNMERGARKVWSNLPVEARVENLELKGDLAAVYEYRKELRQEMYDLAQIPEIVFRPQITGISNTSGLALQMLYQPLVEKTNRKRLTYQKALQQCNRFLLEIHEKILGDDIGALADDASTMYETDIEWTSLLPKDEMAELDKGVKKVSSGVWSQAEAIRRLSGVEDVERLALELAADKRVALIEGYEKQKAALGVRPNAASVFLGSPFLSEDLLDLAGRTCDMENKARIAEQQM
jgi:hypothetical protein